MAWTSHDLAPGDSAAALDRRRGDATSAHRRARAGLGLSPDPCQEGAVLRRRAAQSPRPPTTLAGHCQLTSGGRPNRGADDWSHLPVPASVEDAAGPIAGSFSDQDSENSGIRREPTLPDHEAIVAEEPKPSTEFTFSDDEPDDDAVRAGALASRSEARP